MLLFGCVDCCRVCDARRVLQYRRERGLGNHRFLLETTPVLKDLGKDKEMVVYDELRQIT